MNEAETINRACPVGFSRLQPTCPGRSPALQGRGTGFLYTLLNKNGIDYLLIGGYAVGYHGYVRFTGDIDFWIARNEDNASRVVAALIDFGFGSAEVSADTFLEPDAVIRMGRIPFRVEFLTTISGIEFADCWPRRVMAPIDGIPVTVISLEDLKANKKASGRPKDLLDLNKLKQIAH